MALLAAFNVTETVPLPFGLQDPAEHFKRLRREACRTDERQERARFVRCFWM